jgi:YhcH/YjgK/YiaL family protein
MVRANLSEWARTPGLEGLETLFEYLARTDLAALPPGRTTVEGDDVYVLVSEYETRPPEQVRFEAHRRCIDVQVVVRGQEAIGSAPVAALVRSEPYDAARDIEFFAPPSEWSAVELHAGEFAVFVPGDGHGPGLHLDGPHVTRKAVVKVSVAWRDRQRAAGRASGR